jgi:hypothetical protein
LAPYRQSNQGTISGAVQSGHITPSDEAAWWADLEHAAQTGTFCSVNLGFIVTGQKTWRGGRSTRPRCVSQPVTPECRTIEMSSVTASQAARACRYRFAAGRWIVVSDQLPASVFECCQLAPEVSQVAVDFVQRVLD